MLCVSTLYVGRSIVNYRRPYVLLLHRRQFWGRTQPTSPPSPPQLNNQQPPTQRPGLFGLSYLRAPRSFAACELAAARAATPLIARVTSFSTEVGIPTPHNARVTLRAIDAISDALCRVLDASEAVRTLATRNAWRVAASKAASKTGALLRALNTHAPLHTALVRITEPAAAEVLADSLTSEEQMLARALRAEFERDGIVLPAQERARAAAAAGAAADAAAVFVSGCGGGGVNERRTAATLRDAPRAAVRRAALMTLANARANNVPALEALRTARQEAAETVGAQCWASLVSRDRLAREPAAAAAFCGALARAVQPQAAFELGILARAKAAERRAANAADAAAENNVDSIGSLEASIARSACPLSLDLRSPSATRLFATALAKRAGAAIEPWDVPYYTAALGGGDGEKAQAEASEFLSVADALRGVSLVFSRVFGVDAVVGGVPRGAAWAPKGARLVALTLHRQGEQGGGGGGRVALGTLYLDLFTRPGKTAGAAHYVLRCGKRVDSELDGFERALGLPLAALNGELQTPVVVVSTNFSPPIGDVPVKVSDLDDDNDDVSDGNEEDSGLGEEMDDNEEQEEEEMVSSDQVMSALSRALLSPADAETLFHEVGHAAHSFLSRTDSQHLSGTRGPLDAVEIPSHVFEYWAREPAVVLEWARHWQTRAPLPAALWARVRTARGAQRAGELTASATYALFDLALWAEPKALEAILTAARGPAISDTLADTMAATALGGHNIINNNSSSSTSVLPASVPAFIFPTLAAAAASATKSMATDGGTKQRPPPTSTALLRAVTDAVSLIPALPNSQWAGSFAHGGTYGGGYYAYLIAAASAAAIWERHFAHDPWSRSAGAIFEKTLLAPGASREPTEALEELLGEKGIPLEPLVREVEAGGGPLARR